MEKEGRGGDGLEVEKGWVIYLSPRRPSKRGRVAISLGAALQVAGREAKVDEVEQPTDAMEGGI